MTLQSNYSGIALCYKEHAAKIIPFLKRCEESSLNAEKNSKIDLYAIKEELRIYRVAKARFEESSNIKRTLSLLDKNCAPFHSLLTTLVDNESALDEKIYGMHSNFLASLAMVLSSLVFLPVGSLCSFSWLVTASAVFLFVGFATAVFNFIYYKKEEEKKMIDEFGVISGLLKNLKNAALSNRSPVLKLKKD